MHREGGSSCCRPRHSKWAPARLRGIACNAARSADPGNWSGAPNIWDEVQDLSTAATGSAHDIIKALRRLRRATTSSRGNDAGLPPISRLLRGQGIGWQFQDGRIVTAAPEVFEAVEVPAA
jgi:hypothetical protein